LENILLFLDLDDTIFQTKRKNSQGFIQATNPENPENTSFMTDGQQLFIDSFLNMATVKIIPVTARDLEQYKRTVISEHSAVTTAVLYFSALITDNGQIDQIWQEHIKKSYASLKVPLSEIMARISENIDLENFKMHCVEDFYIVIKNKSKNKEQYILQNNELKKKLAALIDDEFYLHYNSNHISVLPKFLDKKNAVEYLIKKYQPRLTIGAGDSITDLNFMELCDFKMIPKNSQINEVFFGGSGPVTQTQTVPQEMRMEG
jgi:hydroxymethylpyrimidine pyrophosphatase-like HAD family hydrolase